MVNVRIHEDTIKSMIDERIAYWKGRFCDELLELVAEHLYDLIDNGCFEGIELDIMSIVDNAFVNDFDIVYDKENGKVKLIFADGEVALEKDRDFQ